MQLTRLRLAADHPKTLGMRMIVPDPLAEIRQEAVARVISESAAILLMRFILIYIVAARADSKRPQRHSFFTRNNSLAACLDANA